MEITNKIAVITGGETGIGAELARSFHAAGAKHVAVAGLQKNKLESVAEEIKGLAIKCDVTQEKEVQALVEQVEDKIGPIDVFCSNAGIALLGDEDAADTDWEQSWSVHVMGHVYAVRSVAPKMVARGGGYLIHTASAAGLLSHIQSASYSVTKHATVAFAEWVSIKYRHQGIKVSVLAPQAVRTPMLERPESKEALVAGVDGVMEPAQLAECVLKGMAEESFLILPHATVADYMKRKSENIDRWLEGMNSWRQKTGGVNPLSK